MMTRGNIGVRLWCMELSTLRRLGEETEKKISPSVETDSFRIIKLHLKKGG